VKRIDSAKNPRVKAWKKLKTRKEREKEGLFLVEGYHLVEEALKHGVRELIMSEDIALPSHWDVKECEVYIVPSSLIKEIGDTETTQGILAVCEMREEDKGNIAEKVLLIDGIQDPGNLGTIIRTAEASGIELVVLGKGTVDLYNAKTIRSTQGALFHVPIISKDLGAFISELKEREVPVYGTSLKNALPYREVEKSEKFAILLGNEGNGVKEEYLEMTTQNLYIPIIGKSESLNVAVAAGIVLYHFV
jgi:RNA methyltransferase, TrmH family